MTGAIKIGILQDAGMVEHAARPYLDAFRFALDEVHEDGLVDRPFEVVHREVEGLPAGSAHEVQLAWQELADAGVVAIFGPLISENAVAIRRHIEDVGRVPSIAWTGTDRWYGQYCFNINNGSLPEDPYLMSNYLALQGVARVAVVFELSAIGREYRDFFREAAEFDGLTIVGEEGIGQTQTETRPVLERARATQPDALVYLGFGLPAVHMNRALAAIGWDPVRVMNTGFMTGPTVPEGLASLKGWVGCDQYDEENPVGQDVLDRFEQRFGYRPENFMSLLSYDTGALIAQAAAKAHPLSPEGMREGLERVKMLPAATGGPGGVLSFGPFIRRAWLSSHFLVMREVDPGLGADEEISLMGKPGTILRHRLTPRTVTERRAARARAAV